MKKTLITIPIATCLGWCLCLAYRPGQGTNWVPQTCVASIPFTNKVSTASDLPSVHVEAEAHATNLAGRSNWSNLESTDYREYIRNLRAFGCPDATIQDIIVADLHANFENRRAEVIRTCAGSFWHAGSGSETCEAQLESLANQESAALTALLGAGVFVPVTGEALSNISTLQLSGTLAPKQEALSKWANNFEIQLESILLGAQNRELTDLELSQLAELKRNQSDALNALLTPEEREEFELANSATSDELRSSLAGMEVTEAEFRSLFRLRQAHLTQMEAMVEADTATIESAKNDFKNSFLEILGDKRFAQYERIQNGELALEQESQDDGSVDQQLPGN